ncbi:protein of unknown function [Candidatus Filomicrobium marinum]|uniref:Uncharacterized protein n=3 Tax=Candidatus Filomicrobium marinum TaxID=1608628 RepID=A0A0D6JC44_9HYPH|nr:protein of unknown function [Candidatus Filomicrobium marinum]CPR16029.1 protein of unknown function [Candidatus Filomicrobium marinum]
MNTPAAKLQPKRMALGIPPELQATMDAVKEVATAQNIPTQRFPSHASNKVTELQPTASEHHSGNLPRTSQPATQERKARGPRPAPVKRYSVDLPLYLIAEIREKAHRRNCNKRTLILNAFKDAGFTIKDIDIQESKTDE